MLSLYKTLVRYHVEYCSSAWNPHYKKDKQQIEKVQRRFTKMIKIWKEKHMKKDSLVNPFAALHAGYFRRRK